ncbi:MAG: DUF465 domain-containing protein [Gammaproteobacteria bacterium]|nr:MAG: DUF465 domain-containing protein [Gammaproteobacteria bacterium]
MTTNEWELLQKIADLKVEHRDLDVAISQLGKNPHLDQLCMRRLKKRKLMLKDMIACLESKLIPDIDA